MRHCKACLMRAGIKMRGNERESRNVLLSLSTDCEADSRALGDERATLQLKLNTARELQLRTVEPSRSILILDLK